MMGGDGYGRCMNRGSCSARLRRPLTLTLSPKGRGEGSDGGIAGSRPCREEVYFARTLRRPLQPTLLGSLRRRTLCYGGRGGPRNMCFCETNPPFFGRFFDVLPTAQGGYGGNVAENSVGSFW